MKLSFLHFWSVLMMAVLVPAYLGAKEINTDEQLAKALVEYKKGAYAQAITVLTPLESSEKLKATVHYWKGLCYSKLQEFEKATSQFNLAIDHGVIADDVYYENGQALYALNELTKSRKAFAQSVGHKYMVSSSYYYMGSISQSLEQYNLALKSYKKISMEDKEVAQAASMQIGEVILTQAKKRKEVRQIVQKFVIPQLEIAKKIDESSNLSNQISKRMQELKNQYDIDENKLFNGKRVPEKRANLRFQETAQYDTNVIIEAEEALSKATASNKGSFISKSLLTGSYTFVFGRRFVITPELRFNYDHYFQRNVALIYKNETWSVTPKVESRIEHYIGKLPSSFLLDVEYAYQTKDVTASKKLEFYARTFTITLGEKIKIFNFGESTFKVKRKQLEGYTDALDSHTDSFSAAQNFSFANQQLLLFLLSLDFTRLPKDDTSSSNSYLLRIDYIMTNFSLWGLRPSAAFTLTLLDTLKQKDTRGLEKTYNPSLTLTKTLTDVTDIAFKYDYTKNVSKAATTNSYNKHVVGLEFTAKF